MSEVAGANSRLATLFAGGLFIALALPAANIMALIFPGTDVASRTGRQIVLLAIGLLLLLWIRFAERRSLSSIGIKPPTRGTLLWGIAGTVALIASFMLSYALIFPMLGLQLDQTRTASIVRNPYALQLLIFACAAIVEEIIFRGYIIERVQQISGSKWIGFAASVISFTLVHLSSWAASQLIVVAFGAVIMGLLYLWKRDLVMVMIAHFLADVVGFALAAAQQ